MEIPEASLAAVPIPGQCFLLRRREREFLVVSGAQAYRRAAEKLPTHGDYLKSNGIWADAR